MGGERKWEEEGKRRNSRWPRWFQKLFSETSIAVGIVFGILLIWIAYMMVILGTGENIAKMSATLSSLGTVFLTIVMVGGIANTRIEGTVRVGMVMMGVLLLLYFVAVSWASTLVRL